jgi:hypothetical protein
MVEDVSFMELVWWRDACPDVCHAFLQLMMFFRRRHWRRRREDGKDEGNEREEHPGELIHGDVQVCKGRKVARVVDITEEGRGDDSTEERRCENALLLYANLKTVLT